MAGHSITAIAEKLGVAQGTATKDVQEAYKIYCESCAEEAKDAARLDLFRLDELITAWWPKGQDDHKAAALVLKMLQQREHIHGYAAPQKVEITGTAEDLSPEQIKEKIAAALEQANGPTETSPQLE